MNRKIRLIIIINTILVLIFIIFFNRYYLGKIEKRNTIYKELSVSDVFYIIKKYDFFCKEYEWTKNLANPEGKGIKHKYKEIKIYEDEIIIDEATGLIWQKSGSNNCKSF